MKKADVVLGILTIIALIGIFPTTEAMTLSNISTVVGMNMTNYTAKISDVTNTSVQWFVNSNSTVTVMVTVLNVTTTASEPAIANGSLYGHDVQISGRELTTTFTMKSPDKSMNYTVMLAVGNQNVSTMTAAVSEATVMETTTTQQASTMMTTMTITTKQTTSENQTATTSPQEITPPSISTNIPSSEAVTMKVTPDATVSVSSAATETTAPPLANSTDCGEYGRVCDGIGSVTFRCSRKMGKNESCVVTWKCYILIHPKFAPIWEKGTLIFWNGTLTQPDGTFVPPNATLILSNGTFISPVVTFTLPNGTLMSPKGILITPNGTLVYPNGTVIAQNGTLREAKYTCDGKPACSPGVWGPTCNRACGGGCDTLGNSNIHICDSVTGRCLSNETGNPKSSCLTGWGGNGCQNPICYPTCNVGTCVAPNYCGNCPKHFERGRTCRNISLDGFAKGSLPSLAILSGIIILLKFGSHWYENIKSKTD